MAQMTLLQIVNKVLANLGDAQLTTLGNITGAALQIYNAMNEALYEISMEYTFQPLESDGVITLANGTSTYTKPSDMQSYDKDSFRLAQRQQIKYYSPQKFDREYVSQTSSNTPVLLTDWRGKFQFYPIPDSGINGSTCAYRYWKIAPTFVNVPTNTASDSANTWIPEGFDYTLLCNWITFKILHYRHNEEMAIYQSKVWGDPSNDTIQGDYSRFKTLYASHRIEDGQIMVEPLENSSLTMFQQSPITS